MDFNGGVIELNGKWALAGEHSVLRGGAAILFTATEYTLRLEWRKRGGASGHQIDQHFSPLILRAQKWLEERKLYRGEVPEVLRVTSTIPEGAGVGSSAAVSVAVARALLFVNGVSENAATIEWELATHLEDLFHGKSSGMDVAAVSIGKPIRYQKGAPTRILAPSTALGYNFRLHDSGLRSKTKDCVDRVLASPHLSEGDEKMKKAVLLAEEGIRALHLPAALDALRASFDLSTEIYRSWGLLTTDLEEEMSRIKDSGAHAVRLTGSGLGGHIVSLWR